MQRKWLTFVLSNKEKKNKKYKENTDSMDREKCVGFVERGLLMCRLDLIIQLNKDALWFFGKFLRKLLALFWIEKCQIESLLDIRATGYSNES